MLRPKLMRPEPTASVAAWIAQWDTDELFLTAISEAELRYGVAIVPAGRRKDELEAALTRWLDVGFSDRILPFDSAAARHHAQIAFRHRRARADRSKKPTVGSPPYLAPAAPCW